MAMSNEFIFGSMWCVLYAEISRVGTVSRETKETSVEVSIDLDGTGICECDTGIPFLDHMLDVSIKIFQEKSLL